MPATRDQAKSYCFWGRVEAKTLCSCGSSRKSSWAQDPTLIQSKNLLPLQEGQENISAQDLPPIQGKIWLLQRGVAGTLKKSYPHRGLPNTETGPENLRTPLALTLSLAPGNKE